MKRTLIRHECPHQRNRHISPPREKSPIRKNRRTLIQHESPNRRNRISPPCEKSPILGNHETPPQEQIPPLCHPRSRRSDEDRPRGPLTKRIQRVLLPMGLEKSLQLDVYDGTTDVDEHPEKDVSSCRAHTVRTSL
ncbi:hypothetical protein L195_g027051 [Trifolium pratense]|uniref:Uncharacterized protein n=1 Tax=Trifolium pratense TaxID=57577 RepID=A0A2K3KY16_TRIPR|nr:hypothetical protein L195_g027051 [Trifolium pratense]